MTTSFPLASINAVLDDTICDERISFLRGLKTLRIFGRGRLRISHWKCSISQKSVKPMVTASAGQQQPGGFSCSRPTFFRLHLRYGNPGL
jgi:hypothetical protein